ncbi:MAG: ABC transporter permease [Gaiellaceae bacterium]
MRTAQRSQGNRTAALPFESLTTEATERWIENRPSGGARALRLDELWSYRELVFFLALRDIKARYKQALFGFAWSVVQPIAGVLVLTLVFQRLAGVPSDGIPYPIFALLGFLLWSYFAASLGNASASLVTNVSLVTKVYFARLVTPIAALIPGLVHLAIGLVVLAILMPVYDVTPGWQVVFFPLSLVGAMVVALGAGLLLATLNVKYRDVGHALGFLTQLWFLATPVGYPTSLVPDEWRWAYALNPMTGVVDLGRWSLFGSPAPGGYLAVSAVTGLLLLAAGLLYFQRTERQFADVI